MTRPSAWKGRALALAGGAGLVLVAEAALRLVPGLGPPPLSIHLATQGPRSLHALNPAFPRAFFAGSVGKWSLEGLRLTMQAYVEPRPPSSIRVVFAGASTVQGYPHPRRLAAASFLQVMLQRLWPERRVEVLNLGITSIASFAVTRTVEEAAALEPDLVVVYTGHNEFYGVYGAASLRQGGESARAKHLHYSLMRLRLAGLARYLVGLLPAREAPPISLLEALTASGRLGPEDSRRQVALQNLRDNLTGVARFCRERGTPLMLCTLASNEAGFAPDTSTAFAGVSAEHQAAWRERLEQAKSLLVQPQGTNQEQALEALAYLDQAAAACDRYAPLHFLRGRALSRTGEKAQARAAFARARDLDPVPLRAPRSFNEVIRQVARAEGTLLAEVEHAFARAAGQEGIGWELMADHVHPNVAGQILLARALVGALREAPGPLQVGPEARLPSDRELLALVGGDLQVEEIALARAMSSLLGAPPLSPGNAGRASWLRVRADSLWKRLSPAEREGFNRWERQGRKAPLVLAVADQLFAQGDLERAGPYYQAARREIPHTPGELWAVLRWGRCLLAQQGRLPEEARRELQEAMERVHLLARRRDFDPDFLDFFLHYAGRLLAGE
jgi:lysophospholipase L1-like esterase